MLNHPKLKPWIVFVSFFITLNTLFFYGFVRDGTWLVIAILLIPLYRRTGHINFFLGSLSFLFITLALNLMVDHVFPDFFYWRPYERLMTTDSDGLPIYKKNQTIQTRQLHGDLKVAAKKDEVFDIRPRNILFRTDSFGFRNEADYNNEKIILVGDSFIAGSSSSQEDILSSQLKRNFNVRVYNVAFPGSGIIDYAKNIRKFEKKYGKDFKAIMFFFEGNDFAGPAPKPAEKSLFEKIRTFHKKPIKRYKRFFKKTGLYRYTFAAYKSLTKKEPEGKSHRLYIGDVGSHRTAFLLSDMNAVFRKKYTFPDEIIRSIESVKDHIEYIFLIPEKFRVYFAMIKDNTYPPMQNGNWQALRSLGEKLGIPTANLTEPLATESSRLLDEKNEMTFWEDDSHWNGNGAAVAAKVVCEKVKSLGCSPVPDRAKD
ncbi:MAG: SGNH/GDSL hydrolase family protein [Nitrospinaceae bacterium]